MKRKLNNAVLSCLEREEIIFYQLFIQLALQIQLKLFEFSLQLLKFRIIHSQAGSYDP